MKTERTTTAPHLSSRRPTGDVGLLLGTALGLPLYGLTVVVAERLPDMLLLAMVRQPVVASIPMA